MARNQPVTAQEVSEIIAQIEHLSPQIARLFDRISTNFHTADTGDRPLESARAALMLAANAQNLGMALLFKPSMVELRANTEKQVRAQMEAADKSGG